MSVPWFLREEAAEIERSIERLTGDIEDTEKRIVELRAKREKLRFHRAEMMVAADFLDNSGFEVEQDAAGIVTVKLGEAMG